MFHFFLQMNKYHSDYYIEHCSSLWGVTSPDNYTLNWCNRNDNSFEIKSSPRGLKQFLSNDQHSYPFFIYSYVRFIWFRFDRIHASIHSWKLIDPLTDSVNNIISVWCNNTLFAHLFHDTICARVIKAEFSLICSPPVI